MKSPIKNFIPKYYPEGSITQLFGENKALYSRAVCIPGAGEGGTTYCLDGHNGIDIVAPWRSELFAVEGGKVSEVRRDEKGFGRHVRILTPTGEENMYREWVYGHMEDITVEVGDELQEGDSIGTMGNTGFVVSGATPYWKYNPFAGTHLHLGVRDRKILPSGAQAGVKDYYNGFFGAYDFIDMFDSVEPETPEEDLTVKSLENLANQYSQAGNEKTAGMIRAIIGLVKAFTK